MENKQSKPQPVRLIKDATVSLRLNSMLKNALENQADQEGVNVSQFIANLLQRQLNVTDADLTKLALEDSL